MTDNDYPTIPAEWSAHGKRIFESSRYASQRGQYLGHIQAWGLDVYEGSPRSWTDALFAEWDQADRE
jgi:hypothetical protein